MGRRTTRLQVLRAEQDATQSTIARKAGMGLTRYWQIENAEGSEPKDHERERVAAALNVKVSDIAWPAFQKAQAS